jgi:hypothetical protein
LSTVTGNIFTLTGGALTTGTVQFVLTAFGNNLPRVISSNIILPINLTVATDGSGFFTAVVQGNDTIDPGGTLYAVSFFNQGSVLGPFLFDIAGGAVDLNTQAVITSDVPPIIPTNILSTNNTWTGTNSFMGPVTFATIVSMPYLKLQEAVAPAGVIGFDLLYGDSSTHRISFKNNNGSGTAVVGAATTDVLTNKTFAVSSNTLNNSVNTAGHVLRNNGTQYVDAVLSPSDLSGGSTGSGAVVLQNAPTINSPVISTITNTGTLTLPTTTDTLVGQATSDVLTNKTLTSPVLNTSVTGSALQGTDTKLLTAGTVSGTAAPLCTDANGGATTSGCGVVVGATVIRTATTAGCATTSSSYDVCNNTLTWSGGGFVDSSYIPVCNCQDNNVIGGGTSDAVTLTITSFNNTTITTTTQTQRSNTAQCNAVFCIGVHP